MPSFRLLFILPLLLASCLVVRMNPRSRAEPRSDLGVRANVERHVRALAFPRNVVHRESYREAFDYICEQWSQQGYEAQAEYVAPFAENIVAELAGGPEIVLVGAHYDSFCDSPGADDNASAVAAMLEVSGLLAGQSYERTVRFVAFANEEPPYFQRAGMGSPVHAAGARRRGEELAAVLVLESLGYYSDERGSQQWPRPFGLVFPRRASFLAVIGDMGSARQVRRVTRALRRHSPVPTVGGSVPAWIKGVDWSDHWSFWQQGYDAVMVTDMPVFRNPNYHRVTDMPDTLDYDALAGFTLGLAEVVAELASD